MNLFENKTALVFGVANDHSIAWAIAKQLAAGGARLALAYQERVKSRVESLAATCPGSITVECDVSRDDQIASVFGTVEREFGKLDALVHAVAFANKEDLSGGIAETTRSGFALAQDISTYSLLPLARHAVPLMEKAGGGSIVTMTYLGGEKVVPNYNVMGLCKASLESAVRYLAWDLGAHNIRVNAVSAGPVKTLAARGIADFNRMLEQAAQKAPLKRNVDVDEVGKAAAFLLSDWASGITGETLYVDCGYNIMGL